MLLYGVWYKKKVYQIEDIGESTTPGETDGTFDNYQNYHTSQGKEGNFEALPWAAPSLSCCFLFWVINVFHPFPQVHSPASVPPYFTPACFRCRPTIQRAIQVYFSKYFVNTYSTALKYHQEAIISEYILYLIRMSELPWNVKDVVIIFPAILQKSFVKRFSSFPELVTN